MKAARNFFKICVIGFIELSVAGIVYTQEPSSSSTGVVHADPKTASISGRVVLPSGSSADFNIKITLSNSQSPLLTFYTDKHGEFQFLNLTEGTYYIEVAGDPKSYEPVIEKVHLARGQVTHLNISLKRNGEMVGRSSRNGVISASELDKVPVAAKKEFEKAAKLINNGKIEDAIERLRQAIGVFPVYDAARNSLGVQYLKLKRFDDATEQFQAIIERNPKYFNARLNLGLVLIEQKKYEEAIGQLNEAISIDSSRPAAHLWLGVALIGTNEMAGAERELTKALIMGGPDSSVAHYYLAHLYLKRGGREDAARELKIYLQESPNGEQAADARLLLEKLKSEK